MNDAVVVLAILAAVNPLAAVATLASTWPDSNRGRIATLVAAGAVIAAIAGVVLVLLAGDLLDGLDLEPETFRTAAGIVLALDAGRIILFGPYRAPGMPAGWLAALTPVTVPALITAAYLVGLVTFSVDEGRGIAFAALVIAQGVATAVLVAWGRMPSNGWQAIAATGGARLIAAFLAVVAAGLIVSGVRDV